MDKKLELAKLRQEMEEDKTLPLYPSGLQDGATRLVFGEGNPDSPIYFIGEAPGFNEDRLGRPFVGVSGKLLDKTLETVGFARSDVYISNIVRYRPPANRDPLPEEILAFQPYIDREIEIIGPKVVVTLGRFSMNKFLPGAKISQVHGRPRQVEWKRKQVVVVPMYHPAAALRAPEVMRQFVEDFQTLPRILEKIDQKQEKESKDEQMTLL